MKKPLKITLTLLITIVIYIGIFRTEMLMGTPASQAVGNWYQQFLPNLGGRQIVDITFTDSLTGYAITTRLSATDTSFIIKTTNRGDNWFVSYHDSGVVYTSMQFIDQNTGFIGGYIYKGGLFKIVKTTNSGMNWFYINAPFDVPVSDLYSLNEDTIWLASSSLSTGGVFRTTNGGANWQVQYQGNNPNRIYMYDRNLGFISPPSTGALYRTTNSGMNWVQVPGTDGFNDIKFVDDLTGWKANGFMRKTTNGGLNWVQQILPSGGQISSGSGIGKFSLLSRDTIWGTSGIYYLGPGSTNPRGFLYRTIDGGNNWLFQIPDSGFQIITEYAIVEFVNHKTGWAYTLALGKGIHTTTGGDTEWITGITQISSEVPKEYQLFQNYPNPFNPNTKIKFHLLKQGIAEIIVYDITGRTIQKLLNERLSAGEYEMDFKASNYASGVYFYRIEAEEPNGNKFVDSKKMVLIK